MAVRRRNDKWCLDFRPFKDRKVLITLDVRTKREAEMIEGAILRACRTGSYEGLDPDSREACIRMFQRQSWELPQAFAGDVKPKEELTMWKAIELCLKSPDVRDSANRERHEQSFIHIVRHFGKDFPAKSIWIPQIKEYQIQRLHQGAKPSTINKEKAALSKMLQWLVELRHFESNPAQMVRNLSEKSSKRSVYISHPDFLRIVELLPSWYQPVAWTAYCSGMRRGEILNLTWKRVNLKKRLIYLGPDDVKEKQPKRVPIHQALLDVLESLRSSQVIGLDSVFLNNGKPVTHRDQVRWCWDRNVEKVGLDPAPHFHDLRHCFKTNCRRSGVHPEIERAIMGHSQRGKGIHEGYGVISDEELIRAIDLVSFDHGDTEIWVSEAK